MNYPYIVKTAGTCGGRSRIDGTRVRVQDVVVWSERAGWTPDQIAREFSLKLAQVHAALTDYFDNIEEIREELRQDGAFVEEWKQNHPTRLPTPT